MRRPPIRTTNRAAAPNGPMADDPPELGSELGSLEIEPDTGEAEGPPAAAVLIGDGFGECSGVAFGEGCEEGVGEGVLFGFAVGAGVGEGFLTTGPTNACE